MGNQGISSQREFIGTVIRKERLKYFLSLCMKQGSEQRPLFEKIRNGTFFDFLKGFIIFRITRRNDIR